MFAKMQEIRLKMLVCGENSPVKCSDTLLHLTEKEQGEADLELHLQNPCILFQGLEKKGLHYFKNPKCADYVLFEKRENLWCLHIFELKRTVKVKEWETMKDQFMGALQNALALAGFLDIKIAMDKVYLYSVYRNDKISDAANPSRLHFMPDNIGFWRGTVIFTL